MEKKEAMKILKDFHDKSALFSVRTALDTIIPELAESDDEKIRKELINFFDGWGDKTWDSGIKYSEVVAWLEKQGQTFTKKDVDDAYLKGVCDAKSELEKQGEQKPTDKCKGCNNAKGCVTCVDGSEWAHIEEHNPAWSEEDEGFLDSALWHIQNSITNGSIKSFVECPLSTWLKSLKERVQPQPKQEWSEEDERKFSDILALLRGGENCHYNTPDLFDFLKSLKVRVGNFDNGYKVGFSAAKYNQWKPSDEQMERLKGIINSLPYQKVLFSLYQDLLKLK